VAFQRRDDEASRAAEADPQALRLTGGKKVVGDQTEWFERESWV
jgi:hypothetical protein